MDIKQGTPPISQKPYNLSMKHTAWVQKELETLEKTSIIVQSPSMVVSKCTQPREYSRRRLGVDYLALNKLLPPVIKAHSKTKGVLTLVPLSKIDEMYAKLADLNIYSTLDLRSDYYHIALSADSQKKISLCDSYGKVL